MFCTKCGKQVPDNMRFCTGCGAPMDAPAVNRPQPGFTGGYGGAKTGAAAQVKGGPDMHKAIAVILIIFTILSVAHGALIFKVNMKKMGNELGAYSGMRVSLPNVKLELPLMSVASNLSQANKLVNKLEKVAGSGLDYGEMREISQAIEPFRSSVAALNLYRIAAIIASLLLIAAVFLILTKNKLAVMINLVGCALVVILAIALFISAGVANSQLNTALGFGMSNYMGIGASMWTILSLPLGIASGAFVLLKGDSVIGA